MSWPHRARTSLRASRISRLAFAVLFAIPLALLAVASLSGRAAAHAARPAAPVHALAGTISKSSGPTEDLTLHYRSAF